MKIGIIALSFGKPRDPTNHDVINYRLSEYARNMYEAVTTKLPVPRDKTIEYTGSVQVVIVAQQEIARYLGDLQQQGLKIVTDAHATHKKSGQIYLDTQDVLNEASRMFTSEGVREVIVVAHPFLHAWIVRRMVKQAGFIQHEFRIDDYPIGFDSTRNNIQWWCRGPLRFLAYMIVQVIGKVIGKDFHGIGEHHKAPA